MKYTSGLFRSPDEPLSSAVVRMLDTLIDAAGLPSAGKPRILEIGSGWGSLLRRLQERLTDFEYVAINPTGAQNAHVHANCGPSIRVITSHFEQCDVVTGQFDAIFLVGSFCHLRDKNTQLKRLRSLLAPAGRIVLEDTFFISEEKFEAHRDHPATSFVQREVFGFAEITSFPHFLERLALAAMKPVIILEHSTSYKLTIDRWLERLRAMDPMKFPRIEEYCVFT